MYHYRGHSASRYFTWEGGESRRRKQQKMTWEGGRAVKKRMSSHKSFFLLGSHEALIILQRATKRAHPRKSYWCI